jgi:putative thioredoxin
MTETPPAFPAATVADFEQTVLAASREKPVLVDFWADWCGPCKALEPILERIQAQLGEQLSIVKVNADEEASLAAQLGVRGLPTLLLFSGAQPVGQLVGVQPDGNILAMIAPYLVSTADRLVRAGLDCRERGEVAEAQRLLGEAITLEPDNSAALRALIPLEAVAGNLEQARQLHGQLIRTDRESSWGGALATLIELAQRAADQPDLSGLRTRLQQAPDDHGARSTLAACHMMNGDLRQALEELLELLRRDKGYDNDLPRRGLLAVFELAGEHSDLSNDYRRKMAAALH